MMIDREVQCHAIILMTCGECAQLYIHGNMTKTKKKGKGRGGVCVQLTGGNGGDAEYTSGFISHDTTLATSSTRDDMHKAKLLCRIP